MSEPTSWFTIELGWEVADASATVVGEVTAVIGDTDLDIFDGLRFETADGGEVFAPAERVGEIVDGRVSLDASLEQLDAPAEDDLSGGPAG